MLSLVPSEQDRESFIELKDVLKVDMDGNVIGKEKHKRLIDAFIEDCKAGRLDDTGCLRCRFCSLTSFLSITLHFGLIEVIDKREESWDDIKLQAEVAPCRHLFNQWAQSIEPHSKPLCSC